MGDWPDPTQVEFTKDMLTYVVMVTPNDYFMNRLLLRNPSSCFVARLLPKRGALDFTETADGITEKNTKNVALLRFNGTIEHESRKS